MCCCLPRSQAHLQGRRRDRSRCTGGYNPCACCPCSGSDHRTRSHGTWRGAFYRHASWRSSNMSHRRRRGACACGPVIQCLRLCRHGCLQSSMNIGRTGEALLRDRGLTHRAIVLVVKPDTSMRGKTACCQAKGPIVSHLPLVVALYFAVILHGDHSATCAATADWQ